MASHRSKRHRRKRKRSKTLPWNSTSPSPLSTTLLASQTILPWKIVAENYKNGRLPLHIRQDHNHNFTVLNQSFPTLKHVYTFLIETTHANPVHGLVALDDLLLTKGQTVQELIDSLAKKLLDDRSLLWYSEDHWTVHELFKTVSIRVRKTLSTSDSFLVLRRPMTSTGPVNTYSEVAIWVPWAKTNGQHSKFEEYIMRQNNIRSGQLFTYQQSGGKLSALKRGIETTLEMLSLSQTYIRMEQTDLLQLWEKEQYHHQEYRNVMEYELRQSRGGKWFRLIPEMEAPVKFDDNSQPIQLYNSLANEQVENHERWHNMDSRGKQDILPLFKRFLKLLETKWRGPDRTIAYVEELVPIVEDFLETHADTTAPYDQLEIQTIGTFTLFRLLIARVNHEIHFEFHRLYMVTRRVSQPNIETCVRETVTYLCYEHDIERPHLIVVDPRVIRNMIEHAKTVWTCISDEFLIDMLTGVYRESLLADDRRETNQQHFLIEKLQNKDQHLKSKLSHHQKQLFTPTEMQRLSRFTGGLTPLTKQLIRVMDTPKITALRRQQINIVTAPYKNVLSRDKLRALEDIVNLQLAKRRLQPEQIELCRELTGKWPRELFVKRTTTTTTLSSFYTIQSFKRVSDTKTARKRICVLAKRLNLDHKDFCARSDQKLKAYYLDLRKRYGKWVWSQSETNYPWFRFSPKMFDQIQGTDEERHLILRYMILLELFWIRLAFQNGFVHQANENKKLK